MKRAIVFVALSLLVACGGAQVPGHNGYKGKKPKPWEKPKVLKLEKNAAKADVDLDFARFKRAKWLAIETPGPGMLTVNIDVTPSSGGGGGGGGEDEEGEALDMDVGFEILDGKSWTVLAKSDLESDDAHELKKEHKLKDLPQGRYYIHLFLEGRLDAADIDVKIAFERGELPWISDFPNQVAFVEALPAVPVFDDSPEAVVKKKTRVTRIDDKPRDKPKDKDKPDTGGAGSVRAEISDTQPDGGGGTLITIGGGTSDGLENGLSGSVPGVRGSGFKLSGCGTATCRAKVKAAIEDVRSAGAVVIKLKAP